MRWGTLSWDRTVGMMGNILKGERKSSTILGFEVGKRREARQRRIVSQDKQLQTRILETGNRAE